MNGEVKDDEQLLEEAIRMWEDFTGAGQANVIITPPRKEAMLTVLSAARKELQRLQRGS